MSQLIQLNSYRRRRRQSYLARHGSRIDHIIQKFIQNHVDFTFRELSRMYQADLASVSEEAWDYVDFREVLGEVLDHVIGEALYGLLKSQYWFDRCLISQEEVMDRALRAYITEQCEVATAP